MGFTYTPDQQKVIKYHNRNILVSAAAGSGKTAVLVERIIQMICDEEKKTDIDRLLIVTFTSAAASEMRERISAAISKKLEEQPENSHLQRQAALIHNAQITTIDSFCLFIIRNNFNDIGLDPAFRVADEGELKLLKQDTLAELLEEEYALKRPEFIRCVECYSTGSRETVLEEAILKLYDFAISYPWPEEWLKGCMGDYAVESVEELEQKPWIREARQLIVRELESALEMLDRCIEIINKPDGPYMYGELVEQEREQLEKVLTKSTFAELGTALDAFSFGKLPSKKDASVSVDKREGAKQIRSDVKEVIEDIKKKYFFVPMEKAVRDMQKCSESVDELLQLAVSFKEKLDQKKREAGIIDFSDMEHFALNILMK